MSSSAGPPGQGLIRGVEHRPVVLCEPDPGWPHRFRLEQDRIVGALGRRAAAVDHLGSTSVPGLVAKPIIDVLLTVADVDDELDHLPDLLAAGYRLRVREPDHRMVRTPARDVHVHVVPVGHPAAAAYLAPRDRLRASEADRDLYAATKRRLAQREWPSMDAYAEAKSDVIGDVLGRSAGDLRA